jgi:hypothetical protein
VETRFSLLYFVFLILHLAERQLHLTRTATTTTTTTTTTSLSQVFNVSIDKLPFFPNDWLSNSKTSMEWIHSAFI